MKNQMIVNDYTALISGVTWNNAKDTAPAGKPVFLTYSFAEVRFSVDPIGSPVKDFRPMNQEERAIFRQAIQAYEAISGITFFEVPDGLGNIKAGGYEVLGITAGVAYYPNVGWYISGNEKKMHGGASRSGAEVYLDTFNGMEIGVMLHEIGHALGLSHPHDGVKILAEDLDNISNTVMTYTGSATELGRLDIEAIQKIYGTPDKKYSPSNSWSWNAEKYQLTQKGTAQAEVIYGTGTHDIIYGNGGADMVLTYEGDDFIEVKGSTFNVNGGLGLDKLKVDFSSSDKYHIWVKEYNASYFYLKNQSENFYSMNVFNVERILFTDKTLALDIDGTAGQAYRLYKAAFARTPDIAGLSYWVSMIDAGLSLHQTSKNFLISKEFQDLYGKSTKDIELVELLYKNILERAGEKDGVNYWHQQLSAGNIQREELLIAFSESPENVELVGVQIEDGIWLL